MRLLQQCHHATRSLIFLVALLCGLSSANGFALSSARPWMKSPVSKVFLPYRTTAATATPTSSTSMSMTMMMTNWEEWIYHAESAASQLATTVLNGDPLGTASSSSAWWQSLPIMYGAGLLTSVSPCVWGMLPLTMSYISTAAGEREDQQATIPTLVFAAGLASVFCGMGLLAATVGTLFGSIGSGGGGDDWTATLVPLLSSGVCLIMGLQLLDLIELPLPSLDFLTPPQQFQPKKARMINLRPSGESSLFILDGTSNGTLSAGERVMLGDNRNDDGDSVAPSYQRQQQNEQQQRQMNERGSLFRTFLLGGSSALVASPCATPVLTSILAYVASTNHPDHMHNSAVAATASASSYLTEHNPLFGAILLFCYTIGYATPLLLVAATGGQFLVNMRNKQTYGKIAPWIMPLTAGVLLWYGTNGVLTALFGDPTLAALAPLLE